MKGCRAFTKEEVEKLAAALDRGRFGKRNVALIIVGAQTGFRITELLSAKIGDVMQNGHIVRYLKISRRNMKGKQESRSIYLPPKSRRALAAWLPLLKPRGFVTRGDYVFQTASSKNAAISRMYAWDLIHRTARDIGITGPIGTHSLRKTFAQHFYHTCKKRVANGELIDPLRETQDALGHKDINNTIKYLGLKNQNTTDILKELFDEW